MNIAFQLSYTDLTTGRRGRSTPWLTSRADGKGERRKFIRSSFLIPKKYPSQTLEMNLMKKSYMASYVRTYITLYYILDSIDLMKKSYKRI